MFAAGGMERCCRFPVDPAAVRNAVGLVAKVTCPECLGPSLSPTVAGNVIVDWTSGPEHVEIEVGAGPEIDVLVAATGISFEGVLRLDKPPRLAHPCDHRRRG